MPSVRVVQSGHIIEVYRYSSSVALPKIEEFKSNQGGRDGEGRDDRKKEYRMTVNHRAREKLRRLINANFDKNACFVTLTFAENVTDIEKANYELKKFYQKMKRRKKDFKHVTVLEFQKRGAIHYHMLCNLVYEWTTLEDLQKHERDLAKIWGNGFVDIGYKKSDNQGAYLLKYFTKDHVDGRLLGKKRYFFSRNLQQPKVLKGDELKKALRRVEDQRPVFTSSFENEWVGKCDYFEYNSERVNKNHLVDEAISIFKIDEKDITVFHDQKGEIIEIWN